jgi:ribosomal-protein-alanine N-acetyltransferase
MAWAIEYSPMKLLTAVLLATCSANAFAAVMAVPGAGIEGGLSALSAPASIAGAALPGLPAPFLPTALTAAPAAAPAAALPIVAARPRDVDGIMAIEKSSFLEIDRWPRKEWANSVADPDISVEVIRAEGRVAAAINYFFQNNEGDKRLYVASVGVHPDFRKRGYGEALMRRAIDAAAAEPLTASVDLHVRAGNAPALNLYNKLGFVLVKTEEGYYEDGGNAHLLRLGLPQK